jgi:hypothetical protein
MKKNIYLVGGCKGGVGKSLFSMATIDYILGLGETITLFETDTGNPDVLKTYRNNIHAEFVDLDKPDGWINMVNIIQENPDNTIIINTAARNNSGISTYSETLTTTIDELNRNLVTFWVINRQRDSLEFLKDYIETVTNSIVHVICNGYFGDKIKFELYNTSNLKNIIENNGGKTVLFPDLADRITDDIYNKRITIADGLKDMPLGNRAELKRWNNACKKMFKELIGK